MSSGVTDAANRLFSKCHMCGHILDAHSVPCGEMYCPLADFIIVPLQSAMDVAHAMDIAEARTDQAPTRHQELEQIGRLLLVSLGYDVTSDSLRDTPRRFADDWTRFMQQNPTEQETVAAMLDPDPPVAAPPIVVPDPKALAAACRAAALMARYMDQTAHVTVGDGLTPAQLEAVLAMFATCLDAAWVHQTSLPGTVGPPRLIVPLEHWRWRTYTGVGQ